MTQQVDNTLKYLIDTVVSIDFHQSRFNHPSVCRHRPIQSHIPLNNNEYSINNNNFYT